MSTTFMQLEGIAWQRWANELLVEHYGPTTYIKIPDTQGDGGIEGFTCPCGIAYQAYGAEKEKSGKSLYEAQRDKMTRDINKFIDNAPLLTKLFERTKVSGIFLGGWRTLGRLRGCGVDSRSRRRGVDSTQVSSPKGLQDLRLQRTASIAFSLRGSSTRLT
jgi:hypothetical protein